MTTEEITQIVNSYALAEGLKSNAGWFNFTTQFDDRSASINYSLVRHFKPRVVVEFGSRTGRCTHDILRALYMNGGEFVYKSYELEDDMRKQAQSNLNETLGDKAITIGGDIMKAKDIPDGIEYLFVDNYHDMKTTKWVLNRLLKKCKPDALVQIHDIPLVGDYGAAKEGIYPETELIISLHKKGKLPLEKLYWTAEEGTGWESSWWIYKPL